MPFDFYNGILCRAPARAVDTNPGVIKMMSGPASWF